MKQKQLQQTFEEEKKTSERVKKTKVIVPYRVRDSNPDKRKESSASERR